MKVVLQIGNTTSPRARVARFVLVAGGLAVSATSCNGLLGLHDRQLGDSDGSTSTDGAHTGDGPALLPDGAPVDDGGDEASALDGGPDAPPSNCPFDGTGAGDLKSPACWSTIDLTAVNAGIAADPGSEGVAFDGRYLYIAPQPGAIVFRYDANLPFADAGSWSSFDVKAKLGFQPHFSGAMFDGRYVTFVPYASSPLVVRFDTTTTFTDAASWSTFDPTPVAANLTGFAGATFDGQFAYLVPRDHTTLLRHDTRLAGNAGWEAFDVKQVQSSVLTSFWGGVYDGTAVYIAPNDGVVVRYEPAKPFASTTSWSKFDTKVFNSLGLSFEGGAFDGRFVYLSPGGAEAFVVRYDTQGTFTTQASWAAMDLGTLSKTLGSFQGAAFDGRFVYFTPWGARNFKPNRLLVRYDVTADFATATSWTVFDMTPMSAGPVGGSLFDGRFVYFMPDQGTTKVARFEARKTSQKLTLPAFFGSFY